VAQVSDQDNKPKPDNIYLDKVHAVQRVLALANYVLIGASTKEDGTPHYEIHEVGIKHDDAMKATLTAADYYLEQLDKLNNQETKA